MKNLTRAGAAAVAASILLTISLPAAADQLLVAASASFRPALAALQKRFEARTDDTISAVIGNTDDLTRQIRAGAPYDLLIADDAEHPRALAEDGVADAPAEIGRGRLILWTTADRPLPSDGLAGLDPTKLKQLVIANPDQSAYGKAAAASLHGAGLWQALVGKLIIADTVTAAFQHAAVQDGGYALVSLAQARDASAPKGHWVPVDTPGDSPIRMEVARLRQGSAPAAAQRFVEFLRSADARPVLERFGFSAPN